MKKRFFATTITIIIFLFVFIFLSNPNYYSTCVREGLNVFCANVLPCLFPFLVATKLLIGLNCLKSLEKIFSPLTRLFTKEPKASFVFFVSLLSGFPIGVATACELFNEGHISKKSCENISILCNFPGPIFVIGTVGSFFESQKIAILLYASCLLGALVNALIFCSTKDGTVQKVALFDYKISNSLFGDSIFSAIKSMLFIGGVIAIFYTVGKMIFTLIPSLPPFVQTFLQSTLEVTSATKLASELPNKFWGIIMASGAMGFGGLCIFLQCCAFWQKSKINCLKMLPKKATQAVASMSFSALFCIIFKVY